MIFLEPKARYRTERERCRRGSTSCRSGWTDRTARSRHDAGRRGERWSGRFDGGGRRRRGGVEVEIIDPRTLWPLDIGMIEASVKRTGRAVVLHEAPRTCGFGAEIAALIQERCFLYLKAPIGA